METINNIEHEGIVVSKSDSKIVVQITVQSACSECHAKGACSASEIQDKLIEIAPDGQIYQTGQRVVVTGRQSLGFKAVFYAYVLPSLLIVGVLIGSYALTDDDVTTGLLSLLSVVIYYVILYLLRNRFKRTFLFTIKKQ